MTSAQRSAPPLPMTIGRLAEITALLKLEDGIDRDSIRQIAADRLSQIAAKLADLQQALTQLLSECAHTAGDRPCTIIASLALK